MVVGQIAANVGFSKFSKQVTSRAFLEDGFEKPKKDKETTERMQYRRKK